MKHEFIVGVILGLTLLVLPARADTTAGLAWLAGQAQSNGAYARTTDLATPVQATAETLRTFQALSEATQPGIAAARQFLADQTFHNTEYLSRKIIAAAEAGQPTTALVAELHTHQNLMDGGFGDFPGYQSTVLDTALALEALAVAGEQDTVVSGPAVGYLLDQQAADGSWAHGPNTASIGLTAMAMQALWRFRHIYDVEAPLDQAQAFLLNASKGNVWSEPYETALAFLAIQPRISDSQVLEDNIATLESLQEADGSWRNDVFTTALALRTLAQAQTLLAPEPPPEGPISGTVIDAISTQPIANATVLLTTFSAVLQETLTDSDGHFTVDDLTPDQYLLVVEATGYRRTLFFIDVRGDEPIELGILPLLSNDGSATALIKGTVRTDAGDPILGATIEKPS